MPRWQEAFPAALAARFDVPVAGTSASNALFWVRLPADVPVVEAIDRARSLEALAIFLDAAALLIKSTTASNAFSPASGLQIADELRRSGAGGGHRGHYSGGEAAW